MANSILKKEKKEKMERFSKLLQMLQNIFIKRLHPIMTPDPVGLLVVTVLWSVTGFLSHYSHQTKVLTIQ